MSVVIAVKDKNRFVLGSDRQSSIGATKDHSSTKIWAVPELPGAVMGCVGSARVAQLIQYSYIIDKNAIGTDKKIDTEYIICSLIPAIVSVLKNNGVNLIDPESKDLPVIPSAFIFAYKDKAWMIHTDLSVSEIDSYLAIGSGASVATGALFATMNKNPFERIVTSIRAAALNILYVDDNIDLIATEVLDSDQKHLLKALEITDKN